MIIPKLHYISQGTSPEDHLENIQRACSAGAELVQLRLKNTSEKILIKTAETAREITAQFQTRLIINDHYQLAKDIKADGVHLGPSDVSPSVARKELFTWQLIGATANTLQACEHLLDVNVDYISLGPFRTTRTKENIPPVLGISGYTAILDVLETNTSIIGVGGITIKDIPAILETGISGVAVSSAITRDFNTISKFNQMLKASVIDEKRFTFD
ncbi:thiamine phosphate synthase [Flavobacteriaceae bacterium F08102]|nr:thiamine phosphate synthase [Flavobacteriaceae bacterium F08102]